MIPDFRRTALVAAALALAAFVAPPARAAEPAPAADSSLRARMLAAIDSARSEHPGTVTDTTMRPAPDFMLPDLDGVPRRFLGTPGRVLVLVYWSPECPECLAEMPRLARLQARLRDRGLAMVGVTYPRLREQAAAYAREKSLGFPVLLDTIGRVARLYGITTTPTVFVVRDGQVRLKHAGFDAKEPDPVEPAVEALLR